MTMPQARRQGYIERNIHFYRAVVRGKQQKAKPPESFEPEEALKHIGRLSFAPSGRYFEDQGRILCAWVDSPAPRARIRLAVIRREGLPWVEEQGALKALQIPETAGLVEQIHIRCFGDDIVGCDFNFYGPRLTALGRYLREKGGPSAQRVDFEPLVREDVIALMNQYGGLRLFNLRIHRSYLAALKEIDESLAAAFQAQEQLSKAEELEITLRPKAYSRGTLGKTMLKRAKQLARHQDVGSLASRFRVEMLPSNGGSAQEINILDDHLISEQSIARARGRGRALDSRSAYEAIDKAYDDLAEELLKAASAAANRSAN
jgi:hypothetical protein